MTPLSTAEVFRRLQREVELLGSAALAAQLWGCSTDYVQKVLRGDRPIGPRLAKALKLRRVTMFEERKR